MVLRDRSCIEELMQLSRHLCEMSCMLFRRVRSIRFNTLPIALSKIRKMESHL